MGLKKVLSVTPVIEPDRALTAKELVKFWVPMAERPCAVIQIVRTPGVLVDISRFWLFNNPGAPRTARLCALVSLMVNVPYDIFPMDKFPVPDAPSVVIAPPLTLAS